MARAEGRGEASWGSQGQIVDTTGAGDAFVASLMYGIVRQLPVDRMLRLAAVVAAAKCTALGARGGLPSAKDIEPHLLSA